MRWLCLVISAALNFELPTWQQKGMIDIFHESGASMIFIMIPEIKINTQNYVCLAIVFFPTNFIETNMY
jgi:hypothetical protein